MSTERIDEIDKCYFLTHVAAVVNDLVDSMFGVLWRLACYANHDKLEHTHSSMNRIVTLRALIPCMFLKAFSASFEGSA